MSAVVGTLIGTIITAVVGLAAAVIKQSGDRRKTAAEVAQIRSEAESASVNAAGAALKIVTDAMSTSAAESARTRGELADVRAEVRQIRGELDATSRVHHRAVVHIASREVYSWKRWQADRPAGLDPVPQELRADVVRVAPELADALGVDEVSVSTTDIGFESEIREVLEERGSDAGEIVAIDEEEVDDDDEDIM